MNGDWNYDSAEEKSKESIGMTHLKIAKMTLAFRHKTYAMLLSSFGHGIAIELYAANTTGYLRNNPGMGILPTSLHIARNLPRFAPKEETGTTLRRALNNLGENAEVENCLSWNWRSWDIPWDSWWYVLRWAKQIALQTHLKSNARTGFCWLEIRFWISKFFRNGEVSIASMGCGLAGSLDRGDFQIFTWHI